jgi:hypothetical protein
MGAAKQRCNEQLGLIKEWEDISRSVDRDNVDGLAACTDLLEFTTVLEE